MALERSYLTRTYSNVTTATDIQYSAEKSTDLTTWVDANPMDQIVATERNVQTVKAQVAINGANRLFLRLRITRP